MRGRQRAVLLVAWSAAMLAAGAWLARAGIFHWQPERLAERRAATTLPAEVRARLRPRMRRHAEAMTALTNAVMMLDRDRVTRATTELLADPQLARPLSAEAAALAGELPPVFAELEGALQQHARALAAAAQAADDDALVAADAHLAFTCAGCHAVFQGP
jgi:hypothetical protein